MDSLIKYLENKKTFGVCAIGLVLIAAASLHWIDIDPKTFDELKSALLFAAIAALRASVQK